MKNFIYVFTEADKNSLIEMGYSLLHSDGKGIYVFLNKEEQAFAKTSIQFALSDTLTF